MHFRSCEVRTFRCGQILIQSNSTFLPLWQSWQGDEIKPSVRGESAKAAISRDPYASTYCSINWLFKSPDTTRERSPSGPEWVWRTNSWACADIWTEDFSFVETRLVRSLEQVLKTYYPSMISLPYFSFSFLLFRTISQRNYISSQCLQASLPVWVC
jgi:hypothetical protein